MAASRDSSNIPIFEDPDLQGRRRRRYRLDREGNIRQPTSPSRSRSRSPLRELPYNEVRARAPRAKELSRD